MIYPFVRFLALLLMRVKYRMRVTGAANIPQNGAVILCSNHLSAYDPLSIAVSIKRPIHFMGKAELFKNPLIASFLKSVNAFAVDRAGADINSYKNALRLLKDGKVLGLFIQGHRMKEEDVSAAKSGGALFAYKSGAAVVPVRIKTAYKTFSAVTVIFGEPLYFKSDVKKIKHEVLDAATETIVNAINRLA